MRNAAIETISRSVHTAGNAEFLRQAFATEQECLIPKLRSSDRITHAGDRGEVNEQHFIDFLRKYLPNRYTVEKAIVLDSEVVVAIWLKLSFLVGRTPQ